MQAYEIKANAHSLSGRKFYTPEHIRLPRPHVAHKLQPSHPSLKNCDLRQVHIKACMPNEKQDVMRKAFGASSSSNLSSYLAGHQNNKQITGPLLSISQLAHTLTISHSPDITSNFYTTNIFVI
jgi:hypothetical protein